MALTSEMQAALSGPVLTLFYALRITLPSHTARMVDGAAAVNWDGTLWTGSDTLFGRLDSGELGDDGVALEAPTLRLTFIPPDSSAAAALCAPANQGAVVELYEGLIDPVTGVAVPDPDLKFIGEWDIATLKVGRGSRRVEVDVVSAWDRLFDQEEAVRLSDAFHQAVAPGELAFSLITSVTQPLIWGADAPRPVTQAVNAAVSDSGGYLTGFK